MKEQPPIERAKAKGFYKPELDVIRLLAFVMVFFHHVLPRDVAFFSNHVANLALAKFLASIGNSLAFGLPLFFFLSAYLITTLLISEQRDCGRIHLKAFYVRRILRIWPLFYTGLAIGLVYAVLWHHPDHLKMLGMYGLFVGNFYFLNNSAVENPAVPLWSLSLEEQFYLFFPFLLALLGTRRVPLIGGGMVALSLAGLYWMVSRHFEVDQVIWTNGLSQLIFFGAGVLLAYYLVDRSIRLGLIARLAVLAGAIVLMLVTAWLTDAKHFGSATAGWSVAIGYLGVAVACVLVAVAALDARITFPAWMVYLGKISFGLYVFHFLYLMFVGSFFASGAWMVKPIALVPTILTAMLSYRYLETPFLKLRSRFTFVNSRPV